MSNPQRRRAIAVLLVFGVALLLGFHELDRLVRQLGEGIAYFSLSDVSGIGALTHVTEWQGWPVQPGTATPGPFIRLHLLLDLFYMATYGGLGFLLIGATMPKATGTGKDPGPDPDGLARGRARTLGKWLVFALIADVLEDIGLFVASFLIQSGDVAPALGWVIAVLATLKWFGIAWLVVGLWRARSRRPAALGRVKRGIFVQRLTVFNVVVLVALSLLPLHPILEQVPDVQRGWFEPGGWQHGLVAAAVLLTFAATFFVIGRKRSELYYAIDVDREGSLGVPRTYPPDPKKPMHRPAGWHYWIWAAPPLAVLVIGLVTWRFEPDHFDFAPWAAFLGVFAVILGGSWFAEWRFHRRFLRKKPQATTAMATITDAEIEAEGERQAKLGVQTITRVGDVLAALMVIVPGLGIARALWPELFLVATTSPDLFGTEPSAVLAIVVRVAVVLLVIGIACRLTWAVMRDRLPLLTPTGDADPVPLNDPPRLPWFAVPKWLGRVGNVLLGVLRTSRSVLDWLLKPVRRFTRWAAAPVRRWVAKLLLPRSESFREFIAPGVQAPKVGGGGWALIALVAVPSIVFIVLACATPLWLGKVGGGVAVAIASIAAWVTLVGLLMLLLRQRRGVALFEFMGIKSDPIISLVLIVPIIVSFTSGVPQLHAVATHDATTISEGRPSMQEAFDSWLVRTGECSVQLEGSSVPIRPLALVAAEGGGIRAATWTAAGMAEILDAGPCAASSVFLSSGVSGGSIGLTLAARPPGGNENLTPETLRLSIRDLANATALPSAMSGLLVTDALASATGIRLANTASEGEWWDRAALIEQSWREAARAEGENGIDGLAGDFGEFGTQATAPTGLVVLNSTDVLTSCRVVVSEVELDEGETGSPDPEVVDSPAGSRQLANCVAGLDEPPLTIDLLDYFESCDTPLAVDWATAGLLSARFPFVTPSGTIGSTTEDCRIPNMQLVDGGYAENSGLGLLADMADELAPIVRAYNTTLRGADDPLVVPYVIYLQNEPEKFSPTSGRDISELLVPIVGQSAGKAEVAPSSWIQRILHSYATLCEPTSVGSERCDEEARRLGLTLPITERAVVVSADLAPSLNLPLGWGLSDASYRQMMKAAANEARDTCDARSTRPEACLGAYLRPFIDSASAG